ncbi:uncharacterized protein LOC131804557 [Musca domestica]|uniref:Uncharacterized protein LOC131804557 n=1 Tax=Musca domestica TaxID=7370 RepID=A0A1I8MNN1_MUSDO|nr:uncharacterized protein LOC131804557 [Musca domestica]
MTLLKLWQFLAFGILAANYAMAAFRLTNLRCTSKNESLGIFKICSLKAVKRDVVEINVDFELRRKPVKEADFLLRFKKRGELGRKALYNYNIDFCEFLGSNRRKPLANLFYNIFELQTCSNLNHTCPYNHNILIKGCRINSGLLQALPIPSGEYSIWTSWIIFGRPTAEVEVLLKFE